MKSQPIALTVMNHSVKYRNITTQTAKTQAGLIVMSVTPVDSSSPYTTTNSSLRYGRWVNHDTNIKKTDP